MNKWIEIWPRWKSEQACQVLELLDYMHISSRIVPEEFSFVNRLMNADPCRTWPVIVRRKDWQQAVHILEKEGLLNRSNLLTDECA